MDFLELKIAGLSE